jgi:hypothetical protein
MSQLATDGLEQRGLWKRCGVLLTGPMAHGHVHQSIIRPALLSAYLEGSTLVFTQVSGDTYALGWGGANPKHHRSVYSPKPKEKREALFNGTRWFLVVYGGENQKNALPIVSSAGGVDVIGTTFPRGQFFSFPS